MVLLGCYLDRLYFALATSQDREKLLGTRALGWGSGMVFMLCTLLLDFNVSISLFLDD